jgi:glycine C-acetyltransferase
MSLSLALSHRGPRLVANARVDAVPSAAEIETDGSKLLNASTDDWLGLSTDTRVKEAASGAVRRFGTEVPRSSTMVAQLEARLAAMFSADSAAIVDSVSVVLRAIEQADGSRLVDARLAQRCGLSGTPFVSVDQLGQCLAETEAQARIVVIDGTRPFEGDLAPLPRMLELVKRAHVPVIVFDAFGPGPLGARGTGVLDHFSLAGQADLTVSTLGPGAVLIAGDRAVVDAFLPLLPSRLGAASTLAIAKRLELIDTEVHRRHRCFDVAQRFMESLRVRSFDTGPSVTPLIPVWVGDEGLTDLWLRHLAQHRVFGRGLLDGPRSR